MYYKRSFWLLAVSLICSKSVDSHPAFEDAGQLRARRGVSEDEGPSPEYLIGSILNHKAVTGLLGSLVDVPVRQAIQEEDPDSPWASFDFGGLVGLGLQMGGRALQGEKNLLQGRDTAQQLAGILSKFPKSRRELAMEARQARRDKLAAETKTKRDDHDYDDLQDISMRRGSRFGEKYSKEKRTEEFGLAEPSRTTASQREWEVADDYDDVQDVASSDGRQSKAGEMERNKASTLTTPARLPGSQRVKTTDDDYDDIQDIGFDYEDSEHDTQDVVDTYSTGSSRPVNENSNQHEYGTGRKESKLLFNSFGTKRREPVFRPPVQPHDDASYNVRGTQEFGSQPGYRWRKFHDSNSGFSSEREIERLYDSNKYGGKRKFSPDVKSAMSDRNVGRLGGVAIAPRGVDTSHKKAGGPSLRDQWHYKRRQTPMAYKGRYEREEDDGEQGLQPMGFNSFNVDRLAGKRPQYEGHGLPRNGRRRSHVYDSYNSEESGFSFHMQSQQHKRRWHPQERSSLGYIEHERHNDGEDWPGRAENYDENDNFDYDDEESDFSSSTENQQYNQRCQPHEDNSFVYDGYEEGNDGEYDSRRDGHYGHDDYFGATPFHLYKPRTPYPYSPLYRQQDNGYRSDSYGETRHQG